MTRPSTNGGTKGEGVAKQQPSQDAPPQTSAVLKSAIEEAEVLKRALHGAHGLSKRLVAALQRHRKQAKLFRTALNSLRRLEHLDQ